MTQPNSNVVPLCQLGAKSAASALAENRDLTLQDKLTVYQNASRYWRRFLTSNQISLIFYIVDRSVGWGKGSFKAYSENVLNGNEHHAGMELSRGTYFRTLKELEEMGLIWRISEGQMIRIVLNLRWKLDVNT